MDEEATGQEAVETEEIKTPEAEAEIEADADEPEPEVENAEGEEEEAEGKTEDGPDEAAEIEFDLGGGQKVTFKADATAQDVMEEAQRAFKAVEGNYTRKSQEVAEQAKQIKARASVVEKLESMNGEILETFSHGQQLKREIEQLSAVDANALWQSDPDQARRLSDTLAAKQAEFQSTVARLNEQEHTLTQSHAQERARMLDEGKQAVLRQVKDFEAQAPEVIQYAVQQGVSQQDAEQWGMNPIAAVMAYKAMKFDQMQAKAAKAANQPAPAKPVRAASGGKGGKASKSIEDMSMDEYARHMNALERKAASR